MDALRRLGVRYSTPEAEKTAGKAEEFRKQDIHPF